MHRELVDRDLRISAAAGGGPLRTAAFVRGFALPVAAVVQVSNILVACALALGPADFARALPDAPSADAVLANVELETIRRHAGLPQYSGSRVYTLHNQRFGAAASVTVTANFRGAQGEQFTVVARSGSDRLNKIIDQVLSTEAAESVPPLRQQRDLSAANYRVRLLGVETVAGRRCYVLALTPRRKHRSLIAGKAWVDSESYAIVRVDGQLAASVSVLLGAPRIVEDFVEVAGFWLPGHVRSVTSSLLLGPTELDIEFSNYEMASAQPVPMVGRQN